MTVTSRAFEPGPVLVDGEWHADATFLPGKRALAEPRHHQHAEGPPTSLQVELNHLLAELVLAVDVLDEVGSG